LNSANSLPYLCHGCLEVQNLRRRLWDRLPRIRLCERCGSITSSKNESSGGGQAGRGRPTRQDGSRRSPAAWRGRQDASSAQALARRRYERANVVSPQEGRAMSINPPNRNQPRIVRSHGRTDGNLASSKDPEAPAIKRSIREVRDARVIGLWPANTHSGRNCPNELCREAKIFEPAAHAGVPPVRDRRRSE
jgi:hypothetical protein